VSKYTTLILFVFFASTTIAQQDSIKKKLINIQLKNDTNVLFQNKKLALDEKLSEPKLEIGAYLSTYYAFYTEDNSSDYVKHATMAARNNEFGLNMVMVSLGYRSKKIRSNVTLHYGDIAESTWPNKFNMIQEANAGIELFKNLWFDAGIFRSHIGLESTQPRENITSSMTLANVYEPYFFSGAKLTYLINSKLSLQLNAFNSFNSIIETNKNKLFGSSVVFAPNDYLSITYNFITGDDTPDSVDLKHQRFYHNIYATYQKKKISIGAEFNYGIQEYSKQLNPITVGTAYVNSSLLLFKHQSFKKVAFYARGEWFSDEDEILSIGSNMGKYTWGATAGVEYKPVKNMALSIESRQLNSEKENFYYDGELHKERNEFIFCLDVWF
jgi:opacity protein-like surface antigen